MYLIQLLVVAFGFVDILANIRIGGISVAALEWGLLGYFSLLFLFSRGGWRELINNNKLFVALALFGVANSYRSVSYTSTVVDIIYVVIPLLFWYVAYRNIVGFRRVTKVLLWILLSAWLPLLIIALSFLFGMVEYVEGLGPQSLIGMRSASLMLLPVICVSASVLILNPRYLFRLKMSAIVGAVIASGVIIGTLSRTAILCSFLSIVVISSLISKVRGIVVLTLASALAISLVMYISPLRDRVLPQDLTVLEMLESGGYTSGRSLIWSSLLERAKEQPLFGYGTGNSKPYVADMFPDSAGIPHNEYLRNLYDGGVVALALVILCWFSRIIYYYSEARSAVKRADRDGTVIFSSALLAAFAVAVSGIFDNTFLYIFLTGNAFILFGIADRYKENSEFSKKLSLSYI